MNSPIIRVSTGFLNTVNDSVIANNPSIGSTSRDAGQLGQTVEYSPEEIAQMFDSTVGTLYAGRYRYVRVRSGDAAKPIIGTPAFIDTTVTDWEKAYQVTSTCNLSGASLGMLAGVFISAPTRGNYAFICEAGLVDILMASAFTDAGSAAAGVPVYVKSNGASPPIGYGNVIDADATAAANAKLLGNAVVTPVVNLLKQCFLNVRNPWF